MFQSVQSFLAYLLALLVVYACLRVFRPAFLRDAGRELRRQFGTFGCVFLFCTVSLLAGYAVSKAPLRSPPSPQMIPEWFTALGYDPADTDGDGIPDCWERWTRTNRSEADDGLDPDGDGVDNFGEYWHQCDPMMADTDGDGYSDYVEITGRAVGKTWYDPIVPASYIHDDPDCDTNGVPDRWEGTGYVYGFTDANHDGFPDGLTFPTAGDGNFDIEVSVTTTRSALLSWGEGTSKGIVLPPCDGQVVRVRLEKAEETNIRLVCGLPDDGADGLWKARYSVGWASERDQQTEGNRILLGDGTVIDIDGGGAVSFRGEVVSVPTRGGGSYSPDPIPLRMKWIHIDCFDGVCWEHDSGGYSAVAIFTNVAPPFAWYVDGNPVQGVTSDTLDGWDIIGNWLGWDWAEIRCVATNGPQHEAILVENWNYVSVGHCPPGATNFYPITSLPGYDVIAEHEPDYESTPNQCGPNCPETETLDIWAGFAHGGEKPCERNFETIPTGDAKDDETSHCHAIDWSDGLEIDLEEYLPAWLLEFRDGFHYCVNGTDIVGTTVAAGKKPKDLLPTIYHVEIRNDANTTLDRLWIVVLNPDTRTVFNTWANHNSTNATWLANLPPPPNKLIVNGGNALLPTSASANWNAPERFPTNSYMHPKAVFELRSNPIPGGHGHQATYDAQGNIITAGIKAGTADFASPSRKYMLMRLDDHRVTDVKPYIQALQLDGNPVLPIDSSGNISAFWTRNLTRPPLRVGPFTQQYLQRRPTTPTGVLNIP